MVVGVPHSARVMDIPTDPCGIAVLAFPACTLWRLMSCHRPDRRSRVIPAPTEPARGGASSWSPSRPPRFVCRNPASRPHSTFPARTCGSRCSRMRATGSPARSRVAGHLWTIGGKVGNGRSGWQDPADDVAVDGHDVLWTFSEPAPGLRWLSDLACLRPRPGAGGVARRR